MSVTRSLGVQMQWNVPGFEHCPMMLSTPAATTRLAGSQRSCRPTHCHVASCWSPPGHAQSVAAVLLLRVLASTCVCVAAEDTRPLASPFGMPHMQDAAPAGAFSPSSYMSCMCSVLQMHRGLGHLLQDYHILSYTSTLYCQEQCSHVAADLRLVFNAIREERSSCWKPYRRSSRILADLKLHADRATGAVHGWGGGSCPSSSALPL